LCKQNVPASLSELTRRLNASKGGGFQEQLQNLVRAQFVRRYRPVSVDGRRRTRTQIYKLIDPFLLFYFRYLRGNKPLIARNRGSANLFRAIAGPTIHQYYGYAFERLGEAALSTVLARLELGLADIDTMGPFFQQQRTVGQGLQIDWLIIRRDGVWTLLEYKYRSAPVGKDVVHEVQQKAERLSVPSSVTLEPVLVTASGATPAVRSAGYFHEILTLKDLVT
jgi:hypothetical protein